MISNRLARCPLPVGPQSDGFLVYEWNGEDAEGRRVPPGIYLCRIQINAQVQNLAQIIHVAY